MDLSDTLSQVDGPLVHFTLFILFATTKERVHLGISFYVQKKIFTMKCAPNCYFFEWENTLSWGKYIRSAYNTE